MTALVYEGVSVVFTVKTGGNGKPVKATVPLLAVKDTKAYHKFSAPAEAGIIASAYLPKTATKK